MKPCSVFLLLTIVAAVALATGYDSHPATKVTQLQRWATITVEVHVEKRVEVPAAIPDVYEAALNFQKSFSVAPFRTPDEGLKAIGRVGLIPYFDPTIAAHVDTNRL